jgi:hypothetical protein
VFSVYFVPSDPQANFVRNLYVSIFSVPTPSAICARYQAIPHAVIITGNSFFCPVPAMPAAAPAAHSARRVEQAKTVFRPSTVAAWKTKPTWAVISKKDPMLPPATEESAARKMGENPEISCAPWAVGQGPVREKLDLMRA